MIRHMWIDGMSHGGLQDVGIYQSGFGLIDKYVGLIFVAMSTDYYPRLAAVHTQNTKLSSIMNQQTVVSLLILCPVIAIFLPTAPLIVQLLLTKSFLPVIPFGNDFQSNFNLFRIYTYR